MTLKPQKTVQQRIRLSRLFELPDAELIPFSIQDFRTSNQVDRTLTQLQGYNTAGSRLIGGTLEQALKSATYGNGYRAYETVSGDTPSSYGSPHILQPDEMGQEWRIVVTAQDALIRFEQPIDNSFGDDILLPVGIHTFPMRSEEIQIKDNGTSGGTYHISVFY